MMHLKNLEEHILMFLMWCFLRSQEIPATALPIVSLAASIMGGSQGIQDNFIGSSLSPLSACLMKINIQNQLQRTENNSFQATTYLWFDFLFFYFYPSQFELLNKINMKTLKYKKSHQIHPKFTTYENTLINSPKETRVQYKRYLNQLNDTLQSMITAGKLKRMEYISINNRAMFNRAKVQRSEWINQKYARNLTESFQPETDTLKLDNRSDRLKPRKKDLSLRISTEMAGPIRKVQNPQKDLLDELIDEQIQKIKSRNLLKLKIDRKQIVEKACREIENRLLSLPVHQKTQNMKTQNSSTLITQRKNLTLKKDHRRSVTHNLYETTIQNIKKKEQASKRQRVQNHKYFVRKLKKINANSLH